MLVVIKRDGCRTEFNAQRIEEAVIAAMASAGKDDRDYACTLAEQVKLQLTGSQGPTRRWHDIILSIVTTETCAAKPRANSIDRF
jgi:transcriptional regulator NrdR family protein